MKLGALHGNLTGFCGTCEQSDSVKTRDTLHASAVLRARGWGKLRYQGLEVGCWLCPACYKAALQKEEL